MSQYVTDTHPLLWHISGDPRLSAVARIVFAARHVLRVGNVGYLTRKAQAGFWFSRKGYCFRCSR